MPGYYQLVEAANGQAMFVLRAGNHETVLRSRVFATRQAAVEGADWLRSHGHDRTRFLRRESTEHKPYFALIGPDGAEIARSEPYAGRSGLDTGIASVQKNCACREFRGLVRMASLAA